MTTARSRWSPGRASLALAPCLALLLGLAACGSTSSSDAAATKKACAQVGAVLSDGPDPDADPAGYAEAQILPLRQIHAPDQNFKDAVTRLDRAYQQLFASNGKSASATRAVAAASKHINTICPGVAS
jgi:predicted Zn-dependent protease